MRRRPWGKAFVTPSASTGYDSFEPRHLLCVDFAERDAGIVEISCTVERASPFMRKPETSPSPFMRTQDEQWASPFMRTQDQRWASPFMRGCLPMRPLFDERAGLFGDMRGGRHEFEAFVRCFYPGTRVYGQDGGQVLDKCGFELTR